MNKRMMAMVLHEVSRMKEKTLKFEEVPRPEPARREVLVKVSRCGVCHTELDEIEGRAMPSKFPIILGHEVVGYVEERGEGANRFEIGDRLGIGWIYSSCMRCGFCMHGDDNLCEEFRATGKDADGGYAQYMVVPEDFAYPIPERFTDSEAAPLLCAGVIGYRALRLTGIEDKDGGVSLDLEHLPI